MYIHSLTYKYLTPLTISSGQNTEMKVAGQEVWIYLMLLIRVTKARYRKAVPESTPITTHARAVFTASYLTEH